MRRGLIKNAQITSGRKFFDGKDLNLTLSKLEHAFAIGSTDQEACVYADISTASLYRYEEKNPQFRERKNQLKSKPILKAKSKIVESLDDVKVAMWYLERKAKEEFSPRAELEYSGKKESLDQIEAYTRKILENIKPKQRDGN